MSDKQQPPTPPPMTAGEFAEALSLDQVMVERFQIYLELLQKWQRRINLVGGSTLKDPWRRHFLDAGQLAAHIGNSPGPLYDVGSGAGFPGVVLAMLGVADVNLVESDQRKATFLREALRATGAKANVHAARVEDLPETAATFITARAFAPLTVLLNMTSRLWQPDSTGLFLKGRNVDAELTMAAESWNIQVERLQSLSDPDGVILRIRKRAVAHAN